MNRDNPNCVHVVWQQRWSPWQCWLFEWRTKVCQDFIYVYPFDFSASWLIFIRAKIFKEVTFLKNSSWSNLNLRDNICYFRQQYRRRKNDFTYWDKSSSEPDLTGNYSLANFEPFRSSQHIKHSVWAIIY